MMERYEMNDSPKSQEKSIKGRRRGRSLQNDIREQTQRRRRYIGE